MGGLALDLGESKKSECPLRLFEGGFDVASEDLNLPYFRHRLVHSTCPLIDGVSAAEWRRRSLWAHAPARDRISVCLNSRGEDQAHPTGEVSLYAVRPRRRPLPNQQGRVRDSFRLSPNGR